MLMLDSKVIRDDQWPMTSIHLCSSSVIYLDPSEGKGGEWMENKSLASQGTLTVGEGSVQLTSLY
jgi:hypothetical protein